MQQPLANIRTAEVCVACADVSAMITFFASTLGFRVELVFPADAPTTAVMSGFGVRLRFEATIDAANRSTPPATLRLHGDFSGASNAPPVTHTLVAPNGMRIDLIDDANALLIPGEPRNREFVVTRGMDADWGCGRAGMQYRDLIPSRLGGRFIASHIRIPEGGPVPDYVHFHQVRFQMIFCKSGWVRVVYEDQGEPFVMHAGDCVLQPPEIRHRVLEASAGLEVLEIGCPAIHETWADHELALPTPILRPERLFAGQQFVRHIAATAHWQPTEIDGMQARDTGIGVATNGLARARVLRAGAGARSMSIPTAEEFHFLFVLVGRVRITLPQHDDKVLDAGDSSVLPGGETMLMQCETGTELLEVALPG